MYQEILYQKKNLYKRLGIYNFIKKKKKRERERARKTSTPPQYLRITIKWLLRSQPHTENLATLS